MDPFCRYALAMLFIYKRSPYRDVQDHSSLRNPYRKWCMQKPLHFHCYFVANCRNHQGRLRIDCFVVAVFPVDVDVDVAAAAAAACTEVEMGAPHKLSALMGSAAAAGALDYNSHPVLCAAEIVARQRRQRQQGLYHSA